MRRFISLVVLSLIFTITDAQESLFATLQTEKKARLTDPSDDKTLKGDKLYVFKVYGENGKPKGEIEPHFMGNAIAEKWAMVNELYLHKTEVSIGFGTSYTETFKPSILNAVYTMNTYYKKALKRKTIREDDAQKQFVWILDCAIEICHCSDSKDFELALAKAKNAFQILSLFNSVKIENN